MRGRARSGGEKGIERAPLPNVEPAFKIMGAL